MRRSLGFALMTGKPAARRTGCGRCGDSFVGSSVEGRDWLAAHMAAEHAPRLVVTVPAPDLVAQVTRRLVPVLRESLG
jgi:hypothetical protein